MPADESLLQLPQMIDALDRYEGTTNLVVASKVKTQPPSFSLRHVQIHQSLIGDLMDISKRAGRAVLNSQLIPYDPSYKPDSHEVMHISLDDNVRLKNLVESMMEVGVLDVLTDDSAYYSHLSLYGIVHNTTDRNWLILRGLSDRNVLRRSRKLGLLFRDGVFDRLESEVLLLDRDIDCFPWDGYMYVLNMSGFHRVTQYHDEVVSAASAVIADAASRIPIFNLDDFKGVGTSDYRMAAKLASIKNKPYLANLTLSKVREVIERHKLPIEINVDAAGKEALIFDPDPQRRFLILKLLDDDYLHSNMTEQDYAVNSKVAI